MTAAAARFAAFMLLSAMTVSAYAPGQSSSAAARQPMPCRYFPETGKTLCGRFLVYWEEHGGLTQQGYPVTGEFREQSDVDGKTYTVQYFERAVFELHPQNSPPYDVLLSLLGRFEYNRRYNRPGVPGPEQKASTDNPFFFQTTGHTMGGPFRAYWEGHGGLAQQGYPITDELTEKSEIDGKTYTVQYFERAVFELHLENKPPYNVLLSHLGLLRFRAKYAGREPGTPEPTATAPADPYATLRTRPLKMPVATQGQPCPRASGRIVSPSFGPALGSGPVYPVGLGSEGIIDLTGALEEGGWLYAKVLWVAAPAFRGPVLVRGGRLDAVGELRFEHGPDPARELALNTGSRGPDAEGWTDWPSYTRLRGPGCYAYQVDAPGFTLVIPFEAR